jgi:uncharacterized protein (DUF1800 family)
MRHSPTLTVLAILAAVLGGCGHTAPLPGSEPAGSAAPGPAMAVAATDAVPARVESLPADDASVVHLLSRITHGARHGDVARVRAMGLAAYVEQHLHPERIDDGALEVALSLLPSLQMSIPELLRAYPRPDPATRERLQSGQMTRREMLERYPPDRRPSRIVAELQAAKMLRAVRSERQLQEVMVDFWFNHFNVYAQKGEVRWYVSAYEREAIRPHVFGKFRDLVRATARHPAMLFYLDNWLSARADFVVRAGPNRGRKGGLNENYARELMELHTLGVDGGYTQGDVKEVARAFTGWSIERPQAQGRFIFRRAMHDTAEKVVLGQRLRSGGDESDGERVIEILTRHPSTARSIATKLARRFVSDEPPHELVERVAAVYQRTDGDIRAMLQTILTAPEFYRPEVRRAKIKKPFEFVASAVRALDGSLDARAGLALAAAVARIGERLYEAEPPTGYPDRAEPWVNAGALLARMNFGLGLSENRLEGVRVDLESVVAGVDRRRPEAVLDRLLTVFLHGNATPATRRVLTAQLADPEITRQTTDDRGPANTDVEKLAALVLGSPEFQRR